jgi:hypothetical protein
MRKTFWTQDELPFAKFLTSFKENLVKDFVRENVSLGDAKYTRPVLGKTETGLDGYLDYREKLETNGVPDVDAWRALPFKYKRREVIDFSLPPIVLSKFPTAAKLVKHFGEEKCNTAMYSLLAPNTKIKPHTDGEDLEREFVRIHMPLIVPAGDCYFEINNSQKKWDSIWAFDTQETHSAYNNTDEWRLVFILDLRRSKVGLDE